MIIDIKIPKHTKYKMYNNIQHIIALIDRSGSMAGKEKDTIGGINTMLNQLKKGNIYLI